MALRIRLSNFEIVPLHFLLLVSEIKKNKQTKDTSGYYQKDFGLPSLVVVVVSRLLQIVIMRLFEKSFTATVKKTSVDNTLPHEQSLQKVSSRGRQPTVVEEMNITEIEYRNDGNIFDDEENIFDTAYSAVTAAFIGKRDEFNNSDEGPFDFVCTHIEYMCGFEEDKLAPSTAPPRRRNSIRCCKTTKKESRELLSSPSFKKSSTTTTTSSSKNKNKSHGTNNTLFKIVRSSPKEKPGVSLIELNNTIYIGRVKEDSKFDYTGLQSGMKLVSINGIVPDSLQEAKQLLKRRQKTISIVTENKEGKEKEEEEQHNVNNEEEDIRRKFPNKRTMLV